MCFGFLGHFAVLSGLSALPPILHMAIIRSQPVEAWKALKLDKALEVRTLGYFIFSYAGLVSAWKNWNTSKFNKLKKGIKAEVIYFQDFLWFRPFDLIRAA